MGIDLANPGSQEARVKEVLRNRLIPLFKADVGLPSVDNTTDQAKPISIAVNNALANKQNVIALGNSSQYLRGDGSIAALNKIAVGLNNVDNTSDIDKPVSTAVNSAISAITTSLSTKAPLASPVFTGTPTSTTPVSSDNSTKIATTAFVKAYVDAYVSLSDDQKNVIDTFADFFPNPPSVESFINQVNTKLQASNNLSDVTNVGTARVNLGLGSAAQMSSGAFAAASHVHSIVTGGADGFMSSTDKAKLDGIQANATSNSSDTSLKDRANHTGTQAISTITNLQTTLDSKIGGSGGTITGPLTLSTSGANRSINWNTNSSMRWQAYATAVAEGGSNSGSDWALARFTDAGSYIDVPFIVSRSTGVVQATVNLSIAGYQAIHANLVATAAEIRAGTVGSTKYLTAENIAAALQFVTLTDASSIVLDWSTGINFSVALNGNRTLANPTGVIVGSTRVIFISGVGSTRTLAFGSNYVANPLPTITASPTTYFCLQLYAQSATRIIVSGVAL